MSEFRKSLMRIYTEYLRETGRDSAELHELYEWARKKGLWDWKPEPAAKQKRFIEEMSRALKDVRTVDQEGREVRPMCSVVTKRNGELFSEWGNIKTWKRKKVEMSFGLQKKAIVDDCYSLKRKVDYFNTERSDGPNYELNLDITNDVAEREMEETIKLKRKNRSNERERPSRRSRDVVPESISQPSPSRP